MANFSSFLTLSVLVALGSTTQAQTPTFAPFVAYQTGAYSSPSGIAVADVNGDSKLDIITANTFNDAIGVLLGSGDGTFQAVRTYVTGIRPYPDGYSHQPVRVAVADMDGDRKPDVVVENIVSNSIGILLGNGDGTFKAVTTSLLGVSSLNATGLAVADVNADGRPDVLTANYSINAMSVLLASSSGVGLAPPVNYAVGEASNPRNITVTDINNDGKPDALTTNSKSATVGILLGNGDGTFKAVTTFPTDNGVGNAIGIATGDLNGDGKRDVLTLDDFNVDVLLGNGNGTLQTARKYPIDIYLTGPMDLAVADINGDGRLDALTANYITNTVGVLQGLGTGAFKPGLSFNVGTLAEPVGVAVADVNRDGKPDLLTVNKNTTSVSVLLNTTAYTPLAARAALPGSTISLAPNPAHNQATLTLVGLPATVVQVQATLLDATGRAVQQQTLIASQGSIHAEVATGRLGAGLYMLRLVATDTQGQPADSLPTQRLSVL